MRLTNGDVIGRFVRGDTGHIGSSVSSRENALYSYNARIAEWDDGDLVIHDGWDGYSVTTSTHFKHLHDALESVGVEWTATHEPSGKGKKKARWN